METLTEYDPSRWLYEGVTIRWRDAFTQAEPAEFYDCTFAGCAWPEASTRRWVLEGCRFEGSDLSLWRPTDCTFAEVKFEDCKLVGVEWTAGGGIRFDARFVSCDLSLSRFSSMSLLNAEFESCRLREADLSEAKLGGVSLRGCDLAGASLDGADLRGADLRDAVLPPLSLDNMLLAGARIDIPTALALVETLGLRTD